MSYQIKATQEPELDKFIRQNAAEIFIQEIENLKACATNHKKNNHEKATCIKNLSTLITMALDPDIKIGPDDQRAQDLKPFLYQSDVGKAAALYTLHGVFHGIVVKPPINPEK